MKKQEKEYCTFLYLYYTKGNGRRENIIRIKPESEDDLDDKYIYDILMNDRNITKILFRTYEIKKVQGIMLIGDLYYESIPAYNGFDMSIAYYNKYHETKLNIPDDMFIIECFNGEKIVSKDRNYLVLDELRDNIKTKRL